MKKFPGLANSMFMFGPDDGAGGNGDSKKNPTREDGEKKYTDKEVDALISKKFAKWQAQIEAQQKQSEKFKGLSDVEKANAQREEAEKLADEYKAQLERIEMQQTSRGLLTDASMPVQGKVASSVTVGDTGASVNAMGRKIIPAGTPVGGSTFPAAAKKVIPSVVWLKNLKNTHPVLGKNVTQNVHHT